MREIKFRGKSITEDYEGNWLYSSGICYGDDIKLMYCDNDTSETWYYIDKETLGQYIGLKDKNDKEIYEGDIVKIDCPTMKMQGKIFYFEDGADFRIYDYVEDIEETLWYLQEEYEVIGNIYDNPELLEGR